MSELTINDAYANLSPMKHLQVEGKPNPLYKKAFDGAVIAASYAEILLTQAIREHGENCPVSYPDTAYKLPVITALSGEDVQTLKDLVPILNRIRHNNLKENYTFEGALLNGEVALYSAEIIEALRYLKGSIPIPPPGPASSRTPSCASSASSWWTSPSPAWRSSSARPAAARKRPSW